jgi:perosamine synthetase
MSTTAPALSLEQSFLARVTRVLPAQRPIALHEPSLQANESAYVQECISTGWVSSVGKFVDRFERDLAAFTGSRHAIVVANGTVALHVSLVLAGVQPGDEVLVPALSFVATANAASHCGAVPHFVDSDEHNLGMDPGALRDHLRRVAERSTGGWRNKATGRRLAAVVPMHAFGHPADIDGLVAVCADFGMPLVEDAAESLGSLYHGRHTGTFGQIGALSFNGNKIVTTGGGGALLIQDDALARRAKHLTTTAKLPHRWEFSHDEVAWNFRMPNLNAALGCAQLEQLEGFLAAKRTLAQRYHQAFADDDRFEVVMEPADCRSNYWLVALRLRDASLETRDRLLALANDAGIMVRPVWRLLNSLPMYRDCPRAPLPVAERLERAIINVPSSPFLGMGSAA